MKRTILVLLAVLLSVSVFVSCNMDPTVTVTFHAGDGAGSPYTQKVKPGVDTSLTENRFTFEGFVFAGWSTTEGGGVKYTDKAVINISENMDLYAVWSEVYTIKVATVTGGTLTTDITSYTISDSMIRVHLDITPDTGYHLDKISLEGSENTKAYHFAHRLIIPTNSTGDIIITPTFEENPETVKYIERTWDGSKIVAEEKEIDTYEVVQKSVTDWKNGWLVLAGDVVFKERITVEGDVKLLLRDGATLTTDKGITVEKDASLTIYGQAKDTGALKIDGTDAGNAAIGGTSDSDTGPITIKGGTITATSGNGGAAIGGGSEHNSGIIEIYGGNITASSSMNAAAIGAGNGCAGDKITIYGGNIKATGSMFGAAIGAGGSNSGGEITIKGGTVNAVGGDYCPGIGNGAQTGVLGKITISGGKVTAEGGWYGAGIGGGACSEGGTIIISGADTVVNATGHIGSAGIGGGHYAGGGTITISGGKITATGGGNGADSGAGIGSGSSGWGGNITISGGTITATGGSLGGAGIGGGLSGDGGNITISGGTIYATANASGYGIGQGESAGNQANLKITTDALKLKGGANKEGATDRAFTPNENYVYPEWMGYMEITPKT